ncbi:hypothetical protein HMPREF9140_00437 [Prevotella micans F0438]|uniref:Uncharacterized protein n=1 Tax=Prevotella micans F0438 TaxID=883158 RepID=H1Q0J9_9BACT|nr:hypothetical protein [Prevotella micans]EHO73515.1 hypothetical protein HMPREF9140_00437 [Prevotella micans F0438]
MKSRKIFGLIAFSVLLLTSCSTTTVVPGFERTIFIDYSLFRANGIEVSDTEVPDGRTPLGQLSEIVRFSRTYKSKKISLSGNSNDDIVVPTSKTIITTDGNIDIDIDIRDVAAKIAAIVKDRDGRGIAKMNVSVTDAQSQPVFYVSGIIYK